MYIISTQNNWWIEQNNQSLLERGNWAGKKQDLTTSSFFLWSGRLIGLNQLFCGQLARGSSPHPTTIIS